MADWIGKKQRNEDLDDEIAAHMAMAERDLGSRAAARREFGNEALIKEVTRSMWGFGWLDRFWQDIRYGARALRKSPGFTAVVVLTLALGIGANSAIYSAMRAALAPLSIPRPDRAVMVSSEDLQRGWKQFPVSVPDYQEWKASGVFSGLAAFDEDNRNLRLNDRAERVSGIRTTRELFDSIGVHARLGRDFSAADYQPGAPPVAILSDALWRARFAGDPTVINRSVVIDGAPYTIVGVLPRNFPKIGKDLLYTPLVFSAEQLSDRSSRHFALVGRLADGVSLEAARARLTEISIRIEKQFPAPNTGVRAEVDLFQDAYQQDARELTTVLVGAVGFVLLIACANIASLVLARGSARAREMTIRSALGAGTWRLSRQLLTENLLLALLGGAAAIAPAWVAIQFIAGFKMDEMPNPENIVLDWRVLVFNLVLSLATGILVGLAPAWQVRRLRVADALKATGRSLSGSLHQRLRSALVVAEVALTLVLLVGAGLMIHTFVRLRAAYPGYEAANLMTMRVALSDRQYGDPQRQAAFFAEVLNRARALPEVTSAAAIDELPETDTIHATGLYFPDRAEVRPEDVPVVFTNSVSGPYFETMRIPLVRGRYLSDVDVKTSPLVAVIDDWTAKRYWPNQDPVGRFFSSGRKSPLVRVVGVVGNVEPGIVVTVLKGRTGQAYYPAAQRPRPAMALVVRAAGDPAPLAAAVSDVVRQVDRDQPVYDVRTMDAVRAAGSAPQQLTSFLLAGFAVVALLLAAIGIYGVMAYSVGRRTREFGLRMSLGAQPGNILKMVAGSGLRLAGIGIGLGLLGAFGLTRALDSLLCGVRATDPATFGMAAAMLALAALVAGYVPARRATRIDPVVALKDE